VVKEYLEKASFFVKKSQKKRNKKLRSAFIRRKQEEFNKK